MGIGQLTTALHDSQVMTSVSVFCHPLRAHSSAEMEFGLANQVDDLKVFKRRKRSPRSQGRPVDRGALSSGMSPERTD